MITIRKNEPVIRMVAGAEQLNVNAQVFGGWILSQMDHACGLIGESISRGAVTTAAVKEVRFIQPILMGERVSIYLDEVRVGNSSMHISLKVFSENRGTGTITPAEEGTFIVVAIDESGKPRKIGPDWASYIN